MKVHRLEAIHRSLELVTTSASEEAQEQMDCWEDKSEKYRQSKKGEGERDAIEEIQSAIEEIEVKNEALAELIDKHRNV